MWEFPSIQSFINSNGFIIFWTLGALFISFFTLVSAYFSIKNNKKETTGEFVKNAVFGAVALLIVIFSSWGLTLKYKESSKCRNLNLNNVKAIRVRKMPNEETFGSNTLQINDANKVQEGLKILKNSHARDRKKERFFYGYHIQLVVENSESEFNLYYFAETQNGQKTDIIIPYCDSEPNGFNFDGAGIYSSPSFGDWLRENVEPKFKEIQ